MDLRRALFIQTRDDGLKVGPGVAFVLWVFEQVGGVEGGHDGDAVEGLPLPGFGLDVLVAKQGVGRESAERDDDFWLEGVDLLEQKRRALLDFVVLGVAILGRAAFEDVGQIDVFSLKPHGDDHLVEELAGVAYEGLSLLVFVCPRGFADEHQACVGVAGSKDDLGAVLAESAALAVPEGFSDVLEFLGVGELGTGRGRWGVAEGGAKGRFGFAAELEPEFVFGRGRGSFGFGLEGARCVA